MNVADSIYDTEILAKYARVGNIVSGLESISLYQPSYCHLYVILFTNLNDG